MSYRYRLERVLLLFCEREGIDDASRRDERTLNRLSIRLPEGVGSASGKPPSKYSVNFYLNAVNVFLGWEDPQA